MKRGKNDVRFLRGGPYVSIAWGNTALRSYCYRLLLTVAPFKITFRNVSGGTGKHHFAVIKQNCPIAEGCDDIVIMAYNQDSAGGDLAAQKCDTFAGKVSISHGEDFVQQ